MRIHEEIAAHARRVEQFNRLNSKWQEYAACDLLAETDCPCECGYSSVEHDEGRRTDAIAMSLEGDDLDGFLEGVDLEQIESLEEAQELYNRWSAYGDWFSFDEAEADSHGL